MRFRNGVLYYRYENGVWQYWDLRKFALSLMKIAGISLAIFIFLIIYERWLGTALDNWIAWQDEVVSSHRGY